MAADLTVEILRQIRDEIVTTRTELSARIDVTNDRLVALESKTDALDRRQVPSEVRLATEMVAVARAVDGVRDLLRERLDERGRLDDHERRLAALERGASGH